ncbi:MAG: T9SS type A sorting domain-containing protein [Hymenobacter sp.]|nr:MAG: T9SS type A sorting domain-containing protein [Hymenobacter sp.]
MKTLATYLLALLLGLCTTFASAPAWAAGPTAAVLTAAPTTLSGFTTAVGTASAYQGVDITFIDLTGNVTATASAGFEVTWNPDPSSSNPFSASQMGYKLPLYSGATVYMGLGIRLTGIALGAVSGNVTLSSPGVPNVVIAVSGIVTATATINPPCTFTSVSPNSATPGPPVRVTFHGSGFVPGARCDVALVSNTLFKIGPTIYVSPTELTALVTVNATTTTTTGRLYAYNPTPGGGNTSTAPYPGGIGFTALVSPPIILDFTPTSGKVGSMVTISGYNIVFDNILGSTVAFNGTLVTGSPPRTPSTDRLFVTVPTGATTGPIRIMNASGTVVSTIPFVVNPPFFENFEQGTKNSYAAASEQMESGGWTFREALIGITAGADKFNGAKAARLRGGGVLEMDTDKPGGAGMVTVSAATYATETGVSFVPEISTNGGITYTSLLASGAAPPALTGTLTPYTFTANRGGNVRLRFSSTNTAATTNPRLNLDDISISDYTALATMPASQLPGLQVFPNPARDRVTVTGTGAAGARVALLDLLGRPVLAPALVPDGQALLLPVTLPAGLYLVRVQTATGQRTERLVKE